MPPFKNDPVVSVTDSTNTPAVQGVSSTMHGVGVSGRSTHAAGVLGESAAFDGVLGVTTSDGHAGVAGVSDTGNGNGVYGRSTNANGVVGYSSSDVHAGVAGVSENNTGVGIYGKGGRVAGYFEGDVEVTGHVWAPQGTINCYEVSLSGADCAENFDIGGSAIIEPGSVMVIDDEGTLRPCASAYDKKVGGVISGAGAFKPGITLGQVESARNRQPIALLGKVYCKADATYGPIEIGDMLTTSPTLGHAMKAADPYKAFGAVIGKALRSLQSGQELIPILIALQ
jgi:hypothetical protein